MKTRKEASLEIIENILIDTIFELNSTNNGAGTKAMSVLLNVMRMFESETRKEALDIIFEKGDSLIAEHAKTTLEYVNRIITDE